LPGFNEPLLLNETVPTVLTVVLLFVAVDDDPSAIANVDPVVLEPLINLR
jgi:hypothetical protein